MVKLRLARQGRKKVPIYKIVVADGRAKRDGRFIEAVGQYRPQNEPGDKVTIKEDRTLYWLGVGAQPTDTVRSLLSKEGILLKWHLEKKKIEPARASEILTTWKATRDEKLNAAKSEKQRTKDEIKRKAIEAARKKVEAAAAAEAAAQAAEAAAEESAKAAANAPAVAVDESGAPVAEAVAEVPGPNALAAEGGESVRPAESI